MHSTSFGCKKKIAVIIEEAPSAFAGFHGGPLSWLNWNLEMLGFVKRGKPRFSMRTLRKTLRARREPTTTSIHKCIPRINRTYIIKHAQILSEPLISISASEPFLISCCVRLERKEAFGKKI